LKIICVVVVVAFIRCHPVEVLWCLLTALCKPSWAHHKDVSIESATTASQKLLSDCTCTGSLLAQIPELAKVKVRKKNFLSACLLQARHKDDSIDSATRASQRLLFG